MTGAPLISVVIPSYNAQATIRRCLESVFDQNLDAGCEVIVVDSSDDGTDQIVRQAFPQARLLRLEGRTSSGAARNHGVGSAKGAYIALTDADCLVAKDWLFRLYHRHQEADYAAVGGSIGNGTPGSPVGSADYLLEFSEFLPQSPERLVANIPTSNICYRSSVLAGVRFDGGPQGVYLTSDDRILNWELFRRGARLLFDPAIQVAHLNRTRLGAFLSHQYLLGRSSCWARKRTDLPGRIFLDYPFLGPAIPSLRIARIVARLSRIDRRAAPRFLALSPLIFLGATAWSAGFVREALRR
ncbi:MAG: glycosyltransferase family 2 protein [Candidatus Methylomirabilis oxyfera]|nr:glycosyltransferase family 2 protein [Candidatus Methylomirabilis oxyfera]